MSIDLAILGSTWTSLNTIHQTFQRRLTQNKLALNMVMFDFEKELLIYPVNSIQQQNVVLQKIKNVLIKIDQLEPANILIASSSLCRYYNLLVERGLKLNTPVIDILGFTKSYLKNLEKTSFYLVGDPLVNQHIDYFKEILSLPQVHYQEPDVHEKQLISKIYQIFKNQGYWDYALMEVLFDRWNYADKHVVCLGELVVLTGRSSRLFKYFKQQTDFYYLDPLMLWCSDYINQIKDNN